MQTPTPNETEPDNDTDTSSPDRDPGAPETRIAQAKKQLALAYGDLDTDAPEDLNKHSKKRALRELREARQSAETALNVLDEDFDADVKWWHDHEHTTVRAVPVTKTTAGVDATFVGLEDIEQPPMLLLKQHYPPEDGVDGDSISVHGVGEALELATTILKLAGKGFDIPAIEGDDLDDDEWERDTEVSA